MKARGQLLSCDTIPRHDNFIKSLSKCHHPGLGSLAMIIQSNPTITPRPPHYNSWPGIRSVRSHSVHTFLVRDAPLSFSPSTPGSFAHSFDGCLLRQGCSALPRVAETPEFKKPSCLIFPSSYNHSYVQPCLIFNSLLVIHSVKCSTRLSLGDKKKHTACSSDNEEQNGYTVTKYEHL